MSENAEPGVHIYKVFEEVTTKNLNTIKDYTKDTRDLVRDLQEEVKHLKNQVAMREADVKEMRQLISQLQGQLYMLTAEIKSE